MWQLEFSRPAARELLRMPRDQAASIRRRLEELRKDPLAATGVRKLAGQPGYRLRVGDWRVLYLLDADRIVVVVVRIAKRGEAYR